MVKPKAILFDLGDTIIKYKAFVPLNGTKALLEIASNPNKVTAEEVQKFADSMLKDFLKEDNMQLLQISSIAFMKLLYGSFGISFDQSFEDLEALFLEHAEQGSLMDGLVDLLNYLRKQRIRVAILSNTSFSEETHRRELRKFGIEEHFEFFLATVDYCIRKPDKRIFKVALSKLGLDASDVWYIGNKFEFDVIGANNAEIYPIWFNEYNELPHREDIKHLNVTSYHDLLEQMIRAWGD